MRRVFAGWGAAGAVVAAGLAAVTAAPAASPRQPAVGNQARAAADYRALPLSFEANQGQADGAVRFVAHTGAGTLFLTPGSAVLAGPDASLGLQLEGAAPNPPVVGVGRQPGSVSYLHGDDPAKWHVGVPTFGAVRSSGVYPGVDLVWHGSRSALEYDFEVAPAADPAPIRLRVDGATSPPRLERDGSLVVGVVGRELREPVPTAYQTIDGKRRSVAVRYTLDGDAFGFAVGAYDRSRPLTIDPLVYSTFLAGTTGDATVLGVAVDGSGNAYLAGTVNMTNFPTTMGALQPANAGGADLFVTKMNPTGSGLLYSTYLGGSGAESALGIAIDGSGNATVGANTSSTDFPTTGGAFQTSYGGGTRDTVLAKLNATGTGLIFSTYFGGSGDDQLLGLTVDGSGNYYLAGRTTSANFPVLGAVQAALKGPSDGYVAKFTSAGARVYATYLGGSSFEELDGVAVDSSGRASVVGSTSSADYPVTGGAYQTAYSGNQSAVVARLNAAGSALEYATYLGGNAQVSAAAIAVDSTGTAYVAGSAIASNFPTTPGALRTTKPNSTCCTAAYVTKLNNAGSQLSYSTFLNGTTGSDAPAALKLDAAGDLFVAGSANSTDFPTASPIQASKAGGFYDAFLSELNPTGSGLLFSTFLGGSLNGGDDSAHALALDGAGNAYLVGNTKASDFPLAGTPYQSTKQPDDNVGFVAKMKLPSATHHPPADFDGDGKTDLSVYRPSIGVWFISNSGGGAQSPSFGTSTDIPVAADYDGDGKTDVAVFRPSTGVWYLNRTTAGPAAIAFGQSGDIPVPADYDGDGKADLAVFRPSTGVWYIAYSGGGGASPSFGMNGDVPVPADYDGDGKTDIAVYRPSTGVWYLSRTTAGPAAIVFGLSTDVPVPADYDGDGKADLAVFRPSSGVWYITFSGGGSASPVFGVTNDVPVPGDYDGDGKTDVAVFRPSTGVWYLNRSTAGGAATPFGSSGDIPIPLPSAVRQVYFP